MRRRPARSTRTDTPVPYTTLCRARDQRQHGEKRKQAHGNPPKIVYCKINTLGKRAQTKKGGPRRRRPVIVHASAPMPWSPFENAPLGPLRCRFGNRPSGSEEHTSELQYLMRLSYYAFCL